MPSFPDLPEPLRHGDVVVRLAAERDIPEVLIAYQDDPELHLRLGQKRPPSGAELGRLAERASADRVAGRTMMLTIAGDGSDVCLGQVRVQHVEWEHSRAELGIWVAPQARGRGFARSALRLVASWLLLEADFERVQLRTEPENERLLRAAEAAGFRREGILRGYVLERGVRVDNVVMSLVRRDLRG